MVADDVPRGQPNLALTTVPLRGLPTVGSPSSVTTPPIVASSEVSSSTTASMPQSHSRSSSSSHRPYSYPPPSRDYFTDTFSTTSRLDEATYAAMVATGAVDAGHIIGTPGTSVVLSPTHVFDHNITWTTLGFIGVPHVITGTSQIIHQPKHRPKAASSDARAEGNNGNDKNGTEHQEEKTSSSSRSGRHSRSSSMDQAHRILEPDQQLADHAKRKAMLLQKPWQTAMSRLPRRSIDHGDSRTSHDRSASHSPAARPLIIPSSPRAPPTIAEDPTPSPTAASSTIITPSDLNPSSSHDGLSSLALDSFTSRPLPSTSASMTSLAGSTRPSSSAMGMMLSDGSGHMGAWSEASDGETPSSRSRSPAMLLSQSRNANTSSSAATPTPTTTTATLRVTASPSTVPSPSAARGGRPAAPTPRRSSGRIKRKPATAHSDSESDDGTDPLAHVLAGIAAANKEDADQKLANDGIAGRSTPSHRRASSRAASTGHSRSNSRSGSRPASRSGATSKSHSRRNSTNNGIDHSLLNVGGGSGSQSDGHVRKPSFSRHGGKYAAGRGRQASTHGIDVDKINEVVDDGTNSLENVSNAIHGRKPSFSRHGGFGTKYATRRASHHTFESSIATATVHEEGDDGVGTGSLTAPKSDSKGNDSSHARMPSFSRHGGRFAARRGAPPTHSSVSASSSTTSIHGGSHTPKRSPSSSPKTSRRGSRRSSRRSSRATSPTNEAEALAEALEAKKEKAIKAAREAARLADEAVLMRLEQELRGERPITINPTELVEGSTPGDSPATNVHVIGGPTTTTSTITSSATTATATPSVKGELTIEDVLKPRTWRRRRHHGGSGSRTTSNGESGDDDDNDDTHVAKDPALIAQMAASAEVVRNRSRPTSPLEPLSPL
jgi:hypothetical protein